MNSIQPITRPLAPWGAQQEALARLRHFQVKKLTIIGFILLLWLFIFINNNYYIL